MSSSNEHPTDEALFAAGDDGADDTVRAHLDGCDGCRTRARRLRAGASLIALARAEVPSVEWRALDANILAAAEATAAGIRAGTLRGPRRIATPMYVGVALAAAAAGVFMLRMDHPRPHDEPRVARVEIARPAPPAGATTAPPMDSESARQGDGVVLMLVSPVAFHRAGDAAAAQLAGDTRVRAGDRIGVGETGGRALVALRTGYRLDARAGASVRVGSLSRADTTVALEQGEARLDGPTPAEHEQVTMQTGGWTLAAKGGSFVAKVERDVVRLRVVAGKVDVSHGEGSAVHEALAGDEVELSQTSDGLRVVSHDARDPSALDEAVFVDDGQGFALPAVAGRGALAVAGHGALPAGTDFVRVGARLDLESSAPGGETWSLSVEPGRDAPASWRRSPRIAAAAPHYEAPAPQPTPAIAPPAVAVPPARPAPVSLVGVERARWDVAETLRVAIAECNVAPGSHLTVAVDPNADGSVTSPRVAAVGVALDARACVERRALALRLPHDALPSPLHTVQFQLTTP